MKNKPYRILFFEKFPYRHRLNNINELPLKIIPGVYLEERPYKTDLENDFDRGTYDKLLANHRPSSFCIKIYRKKDDLGFIIINLLRLIKPFQINILGSIEYKNKFELTHNVKKYDTFTLVNFNEKNFLQITKNKTERFNNGLINCFYTKEDFKRINSLYLKIKLLKKTTANNIIINSFNIFSETHFIVRSFNTIYLTIFRSLESLFASPGKGNPLAEFTNKFIGKIFKEDIKAFIKNEYEKRRNNISHGNPNIWDTKSSNYNKYKNLFLMHEIARLAIIKILNIDNISLENYTTKAYAQDKQNMSSDKQNKNGEVKTEFKNILNKLLEENSEINNNQTYYKYSPKK